MSASETAALIAQIHSLSGAPVSVHLRDILLPVQASRAKAYAKLNSALRHPSASSNPHPYSVRDNTYAAVCANVTEDLKVASEAIIALRHHLAARIPTLPTAIATTTTNPPDHHLEHNSCTTSERHALALLDRIQDLEERKLVVFVSLQALKRTPTALRLSTIASPSPFPPSTSTLTSHTSSPVTSSPMSACTESSTDNSETRETHHEMIVRFSKQLSAIDAQITDAVDEARELIAEDDNPA